MRINQNIRDSLTLMGLGISLFGTVIIAQDRGYLVLVIVAGFSAIVLISISIYEAIKGISLSKKL